MSIQRDCLAGKIMPLISDGPQIPENKLKEAEKKSDFIITVKDNRDEPDEFMKNFFKLKLLEASLCKSLIHCAEERHIVGYKYGCIRNGESNGTICIRFDIESKCFNATVPVFTKSNYQLNGCSIEKDGRECRRGAQLQPGENKFLENGKPLFTINIEKKPEESNQI